MPHTVHLRVRNYEADRFGHVHNHVIQQYLEEAAIEASAAAGLDADWYAQRNCGWVIREITLEYLQPLRLNDALQIHTWVADWRRVRSHREYTVHRTSDGALLVRASTDWVFINRVTLWPARIPPEAIAAFVLEEGGYALPPLRPVPAVTAPVEWRVQRRAQRHEIDAMCHVNNANYTTWFEQALLDGLAEHAPAVAAGGWPCWRRHDIEYRSAILPDEDVEIVTRLVGLARARAAWHQEVRRPGSTDAAVVDRSVVLYLDSDQRAQPWPRAILSAREGNLGHG